MEELVTVSSLMTQEDYVNFKLAATRVALKPNEVTMLRVLGFVLVLTGFLLLVFLGRTAYRITIYTLLVVLGILVGFFHDTVQPLLARRQAANFYEGHRERMMSQTVVFYADRFRFTTDRYTGTIPYSLLYGAYEDDKVFLLYSGLDEIRAIPKRALNQDDCLKIHQLLSQSLKEKYMQEGVSFNGRTAN